MKKRINPKKFICVWVLTLIMLLAIPVGALATPKENESQGHGDEQNAIKMEEQTQTKGDYVIQFIVPEEMTEGENELKVIIGQDNKPVESLIVKISAEMDKTDTSMSMKHGNEEKAIVQTMSEDKSGEYSSKIEFKGDGQWNLTVEFLDEKTVFQVHILKGGPNWFVVGGFLGVILMIILVAGVLRYRRSGGGVSNEQ